MRITKDVENRVIDLYLHSNHPVIDIPSMCGVSLRSVYTILHRNKVHIDAKHFRKVETLESQLNRLREENRMLQDKIKAYEDLLEQMNSVKTLYR